MKRTYRRQSVEVEDHMDSMVRVGDAPQEDPSPHGILEATQFGDFDRCVQLLDDGFDVNYRDQENITLLHWAAINCQREIVKLYACRGAIIDAYGGELNSTPLHWATRQGLLSMVVLLLKLGADPSLRDADGCATIHLAAQFGFTPIIAYLLAKGVSPDVQDRNGMTPLMWASCLAGNVEPTRLLLIFGAKTYYQDFEHKNTAMHWAIEIKNAPAVSLLVNHNASLDIPNRSGKTPYRMLKQVARNEWMTRRGLEEALASREWKQSSWLDTYIQDKKRRYYGTAAIPFVVMYALGVIFSADVSFSWKAALVFCVYVMTRIAGRFVFDERFSSIFPLSVYLATKFWMYVVWFVYIAPVVPISDTVIAVSCSGLLWYNFIRAWKGDPGIITISEDQRIPTIIDLAENDELGSKFFCTTCLIRKPLRSKHCAVCDRCVAKFDHHCPWLDNCVGWKNHKYFVGYLFFLAVMMLLFVLGACKFLMIMCDPKLSLVETISYESWVTFMSLQAAVHGIGVLGLLMCHLYQIVFLDLTTNESMNWGRYTYLAGSKGGLSTSRIRKNPGVVRNFIEFFELDCFNPDKTDWMRTWPHPQDEEEEALLDSQSESFDDSFEFEHV